MVSRFVAAYACIVVGSGVSGVPTGVGVGLRWSFLDELADDEVDTDGVDLLEVAPENYTRRGGHIPAALARVAERFALLSHGLTLDLGGRDPIDRELVRWLRRFLADLRAPFHSEHLCWTRFEGRVLHDLFPLPRDRATLRRVVDRIAEVRDAIAVPIAIENISYYLDPSPGVPEAEFIAEVLERADCGLLLDVNNVHVNAINFGFDAAAFVDALPLHRVVQIHVAGGERRPDLQDLTIDSHSTAPRPPVLDLLRRALARTGAVPVIYERDHRIPAWPELQREIAAVGEVVRSALAAPIEAPRRDDPIELRLADAAPASFERDVVRAIVDPDVSDLASDDRRLVYRRLVRDTLTRTIGNFLPRTCTRLGPERTSTSIERWLAAQGPRSPWLRDVPPSFTSFIAPSWRADPELPPELCDLARHELLEDEVEAAPGEASAALELRLDAPVVFHPSVRRVDYDFAVHRLSDDPQDLRSPPREPTHLLVYRDPDHTARYLQLTPMGRALVDALLDRDTCLRAAVERAAVATSTPSSTSSSTGVDDDLLRRVAVLLGDLVQRGVVLGSPR